MPMIVKIVVLYWTIDGDNEEEHEWLHNAQDVGPGAKDVAEH